MQHLHRRVERLERGDDKPWETADGQSYRSSTRKVKGY
jgi:hypothetical protein